MIKAIETRYNGYRFRSRLEARWAVFFDTLGVAYEYEKEGYDLGDAGWYLPDFWLPQIKLWVEIKPDEPGPRAINKAIALVQQSRQWASIYYGQFGQGTRLKLFYLTDPSVPHDQFPEVIWVECDGCGGLSVVALPYSTDEFCRPNCGSNCGGRLRADGPRILDAYIAARSARFEHGEHGR